MATIDRHHLAGGRSGVFHTLGFLVREDQLAFLDHVSLADLHGGFHAHIVTAEHGNRTNLVAFLNRLARCTSDGQIQALPDFNHSFSPTLRVAEVEAHPPASPEKREMPWMFAKTGICTWEPASAGGAIIKTHLPVRQHRATRLSSHRTTLVQKKTRLCTEKKPAARASFQTQFSPSGTPGIPPRRSAAGYAVPGSCNRTRCRTTRTVRNDAH